MHLRPYLPPQVLKDLNGKQLDAIFVCVGGGGLLAGIASYVKAVRPSVKVIGVEAEVRTIFFLLGNIPRSNV